MKKVLAMILVLVSVLSLCACGNDDYYVEEDDEDEEVVRTTEATQELPQLAPAEPTVAAPTEEESQQLMDYAEALCRLMDYRNGCTDSITWTVDGETVTHTRTNPDNRVMTALFQLVTGATAVDKFANSPYAEDFPILNWDRNEVIGWFGQISNVMLYIQCTTMDSLGNTYDPYIHTTWSYDANGARLSPERGEGILIDIGLPMVETDPSFTYNICREVYDDNGNLTALEYYDQQDPDQTIQVRMTPVYDDAGRLIRLDAMKASGQTYKIHYTYDENGNLICQQTEGLFYNYTHTYTCDAAGRITSMTQNDEWFRTYTYDETTGRLVSATMQKRYGSYVSEDFTVTYEYDNLGRVISTHCHNEIAGGDAQFIYDLVYGDFYFIHPAA